MKKMMKRTKQVGAKKKNKWTNALLGVLFLMAFALLYEYAIFNIKNVELWYSCLLMAGGFLSIVVIIVGVILANKKR